MRITWFLLLVALIAIVLSIPMIDRQFIAGRMPDHSSSQETPFLPAPEPQRQQP